MDNNNEFLWSQFCRLGEMIGDGLHYEDPWISKEYKRLSKILMPDAYKDERKYNNGLIDIAVKKRLETDKCGLCQAEMKQVRSGSYVVKCTECGARFKYKKTKKK